MTGDLFQDPIEPLAEGAVLLRGFVATEAPELLATVAQIATAAPFRHMTTPGGYEMSVAMTNCGTAGWVTDRRGYRYDANDPNTGKPWPPMPVLFATLASRAAAEAGYARFDPDACLINRYDSGARLSLHQDKDERDFAQPIVSVSLGIPAVFLFGGLRRKDKPRRIALESGDVVVWGGASRMAYHGVAPVKAEGDGHRINLTFRKAL
jgi:DNA oxidative demethylase